MRFLFVEHHPVFGGPHNRFVRLYEPLRARGYETVALVPGGSTAQRMREGGVPVRAVPINRLRGGIDPRVHARTLIDFAPDIRRIRRVIREERIDFVVLAGLENPHAAIAARRERVPLVWQLIGTFTPMLHRRAMMPVVKRLADVVMTTGPTVARMHPGAEALGDRLVPFFSPVDIERLAPSPERRATARRELGIADDQVVVGNVGNVNPQKGHRTFIQAAADLHRSHPDVRFAILGESYETHRRYEERIWAEGRALGVERDRNLIFRSPGARAPELAAAFDVFWLPSVPRSEGIPNVVLEAMAQGLPVVSTEVGGVRDVVHDGETGFVVPPLTPEEMAAATRPLVEDPGLRRRIGAAAREFAVANCRVEVSAATHVRAFERALARGAERSARSLRSGASS